ncbi:hypothetical protein [Zhihengliuella flava]|uniref:Uncharacterized protein n=1 Tax=Zhihengliuella flava TaxID=1285193 RepID=A0A931D5Q2_9MICC|nr:hypothetical protein [Zhihengliuella flava]MBG6084190.1 hypothetical protein [Zhihengliuella flava]
MDSPETPPAPDSIDVEVRRSPKFWPFLGAGAFVGVLVALISAYTGEPSTEFTRGAVAGFLLVIFGVIGVAVGAVAYLIADKVASKKARRTRAELIDDDTHHASDA